MSPGDRFKAAHPAWFKSNCTLGSKRMIDQWVRSGKANDTAVKRTAKFLGRKSGGNPVTIYNAIRGTLKANSVKIV